MTDAPKNIEAPSASNPDSKGKIVEAGIDLLEKEGGFDQVVKMINSSDANNPDQLSTALVLITLMETYAQKGGPKGRAALDALEKIGALAPGEIGQAAVRAHTSAERSNIERAAR